MQTSTGASSSSLLKTSTPFSPRGAGSFAEFNYLPDPYEMGEVLSQVVQSREAAEIRAGAFKAGGNAGKAKLASHRRSADIRTHLFMELKADCPSFLRVTEDPLGHVLAVFSASQVPDARRSDLHSYMNRFASKRPMVAECGLARDLSRWGSVAGGTDPIIVYSFRPPWVANNPLGIYSATGANSPRRVPDSKLRNL